SSSASRSASRTRSGSCSRSEHATLRRRRGPARFERVGPCRLGPWRGGRTHCGLWCYPTRAMQTDEELFRRARQGDLTAFDQLYLRHERRLFGFILRLLGDRADAEEIFHDVFLSAFKAKDVQLEEARFAAWIYRIARNACANKVRSRRRGANALF